MSCAWTQPEIDGGSCRTQAGAELVAHGRRSAAGAGGGVRVCLGLARRAQLRLEVDRLAQPDLVGDLLSLLVHLALTWVPSREQLMPVSAGCPARRQIMRNA